LLKENYLFSLPWSLDLILLYVKIKREKIMKKFVRSGTKKEKFGFLFIVLCAISLLVFASPHFQKKPATVPNTEAIEKELWSLVNKERGLQSVPLLELSSTLSELARQHSLDMAHQGKPTHRSSNGKTLIHRLEDAGFFYVNAGENVAFSETFVAEFIHKAFFESREHKENILDPDFTHIGIGVVQSEGKGYFVTQDFLHPLVQESDKQVSRTVLEHINKERRSAELPPLKQWKNAERFAQNLAEKKAKGLPLPDIPPEYGETLVVFLLTPRLDPEKLLFKDAVDPSYNTGALGVWFGKSRDYPGGNYALALLLFAENRQASLSSTDQRKIILDQVNKIRTKYSLKMLTLDERLTEAAKRMASKPALRGEMPLFPDTSRYESLTYSTEDLSILPASLNSMVKKSSLRKIGIRLVYRKKRSSLNGTFIVKLLLE
jgi:uncharacterized protein YkwD